MRDRTKVKLLLVPSLLDGFLNVCCKDGFLYTLQLLLKRYKKGILVFVTKVNRCIHFERFPFRLYEMSGDNYPFFPE